MIDVSKNLYFLKLSNNKKNLSLKLFSLLSNSYNINLERIIKDGIYIIDKEKSDKDITREFFDFIYCKYYLNSDRPQWVNEFCLNQSVVSICFPEKRRVSISYLLPTLISPIIVTIILSYLINLSRSDLNTFIDINENKIEYSFVNIDVPSFIKKNTYFLLNSTKYNSDTSICVDLKLNEYMFMMKDFCLNACIENYDLISKNMLSIITLSSPSSRSPNYLLEEVVNSYQNKSNERKKSLTSSYEKKVRESFSVFAQNMADCDSSWYNFCNNKIVLNPNLNEAPILNLEEMLKNLQVSPEN